MKKWEKRKGGTIQEAIIFIVVIRIKTKPVKIKLKKSLYLRKKESALMTRPDHGMETLFLFPNKCIDLLKELRLLSPLGLMQ